ncbi:MAG: cytochrome c oxidase subunit II [Actinobacteria bacterium]|nr:cytochrome c oxidase subunit II [Actinomycetota bacterium]
MLRRRGALGGARQGRKALAVPLCALAVILGPTGAAHAGTGGLTPVDQKSPNVERSTDIYYLILGFSGLIMLLVTVPLLIFIVRYRGRGRSREVEGAQIRGNTRLELAWTALPVLILAVIAGFVFYKVPGITDLEAEASGDSRLEIKVDGRQFYWQYRYPNDVIAIDTLRVPLGQVVELEIGAPESDVNHSFWIPALGGKFDAIPGETTRTSFRADEVGTYEGQCAEFCGVQHAAMLQAVEVMPRGEFETWLANEAGAQRRGASELGERTYQGACAKCHGMAGEGLIGPPLAGNSLLQDRDALEMIVRNGQGAMPAVGEGWEDRQMDALFRHLRRNVAGGSGAEDGS